MCLILLAYDSHPEYPLVFAGNRDEFYDRPAAPAAFWTEAPHVLAGRDLASGGTWLGVTRRGHWATVTNVRDQTPYRDDAPSRGHLVAEYLKTEPDPESYLRDVADRADAYNGFNLLVGTPTTLYYVSNRGGTPQAVSPGVHGMSNAQLDEPWPKVERGTSRLRSVLEHDLTPESLLDLLEDRKPAPDDQLPETGVGRDTERELSPPFIEGDRYGTRASTVLLIDRSGTVTFVERTFDRGTPDEVNHFSFEISP